MEYWSFGDAGRHLLFIFFVYLNLFVLLSLFASICFSCNSSIKLYRLLYHLYFVTTPKFIKQTELLKTPTASMEVTY